MTSTREHEPLTDLSDKPSQGAFGWLTSFGSKAILWFLVVLWVIPTLGLFISSFRPEAAIKTSGWWTFFTEFDFTMENYNFVLFGEGSGAPDMAAALLNSLAIVIPATLRS
jgi:alpha-glucoside transport system permease protein